MSAPTSQNALCVTIPEDGARRDGTVTDEDQSTCSELPPPACPNLSTRNSCSFPNVNFDCETQQEPPTETRLALLQEAVPPPSDSVLVTPWLRFSTWFTPYRKILMTVVVLNLTGSVLEMNGVWPAAGRHLSSFVLANLLCAIAIRNEWVLRFLYWSAIKLFRRSLPVRLRAIVVGFLYHIGGLHSGCGIGALCWLVAAFEQHTRSYELYHPATLATLAACLICVTTLNISAFPIFRRPHHNVFEIIHRFIGWLGVLCTLTFMLLSNFWSVEHQNWDITYQRIATSIEMWLLLAVFIFIITSWITVSKVIVEFLTDSKTVSVIRFPGGLTSGLHTRISRGGLREWHIFGSISEGKHAKFYYVVAAVQGNFTRNLNIERPAQLYTKWWKPCGLPYFSRMFSRGVAICTGSGIGAVGSTCIQHDDWFLVWIGPNLESTYGTELVQFLSERIPAERRIIWDTRGPKGRPNVFSVLEQVFRSWEAEVALFIGSPALNKTILQASRAKKIPLFGSIWDA